ncbi:hypothetical protein K431DRAFT_284973 [Polychaeton citri CBS 116435]|uniref:DUF7357 domain-containing protein n=1 Tax=Polychaeton citri CBS 116435 TaxID=1314669 RepID=A0A9P4Q8E1_9PEZI|nr:hypothetical protein K431DRAFT_284973 [Polychaeton citri CBS 116435]
MRLRLQIRRQDLPTVNTLWPLSDQQLKQPISQLLASVNDTFPLETDKWGLEDYIVQVGGYECLHYHEIGNICRDDEEVVIRPLQYAEVRGRTLLGRTQIHSNGMHLVDGVPFGRPLVRSAPIRPTGVRIPPRKKVRIGEERSDELAEFAYGLGPSLEDRVNNEYGQLVRPGDHASAEAGDDHANPRQITWQPHTFDDGEDDGEEDEEEDLDFDDGDVGEDQDSSSASGSSSNDDVDESDSKDVSELDADDSSNHSVSSTSDASSSSSSLSDSDSQSDTSSSGDDSPDIAIKKHVTRLDSLQSNPAMRTRSASTTSLPYQGKQETKNRNARRRDSKRLAHLKNEGVLLNDATFEDMRRYDLGESTPLDTSHTEEPNVPQVGADGNATSVTTDSTSTKTLLHEQEYNVQQLPTAKKHKASRVNNPKPDSAEFEKRRRALLNDLAESGVELRHPQTLLRESTVAPEEMSSKDPTISQSINGANEPATLEQQGAAVVDSNKSNAMVPPAVVRRAKLDLASSKRFLFGSLGVRVPKSREEKDRLQKKLADRHKTRSGNALAPEMAGTTAQQDEEEEGQGDDDHPDAWRSKIILRAVECVEEGVNLSTPPFPFYQRWDVQQQRQGKRKKSKSGKYMAVNKKRKYGGEPDEYFEIYDKYNTDGYGDELDYDGAAQDDVHYYDEGEYCEEGALFNGHTEGQEGNKYTFHREEDDGFPQLPADISSLPIVSEPNAQAASFVVFTEFTVSAATHWSPASVTRTAQLVSKEEDPDNAGKTAWTIKLALRDLPPREFDGDGNRVYSKFETETFSDDEDGEGGDSHQREKVVEWAEIEACAPVRLLKKPEASELEI